MVQHEPKACRFCGDEFIPHYKVGARQIACSKQECQRARCRANLNRLYRSDPGYNYDNVKRYRAIHPDYQKQRRQKLKAALAAQSPASETLLNTRPGQRRQRRIPASLLVSSSSQTHEIQTELTSVKTAEVSKDSHSLREIQTELTLSFSVQLAKLLTSLPQPQNMRYKSS